MTEKSPTLKLHEEALAEINAMDSLAELNGVNALLKDKYKALPDNNKRTLLTVAIMRKDAIQDGKPMPDTEEAKVEKIKDDYKEIDKENFGPEEVKMDDTPPKPVEVEVTVTAVAKDPEDQPMVDKALESLSEEKPKKAKAKAEKLPGGQTVTLTRRVNVPVEGIEYSNNEVIVSVTGDNIEQVRADLATIFEYEIKDRGLIKLSTHKILVQREMDQLVKTMKPAQAPTPPSTPVPTSDLTSRQYARLKDLMQFVYTNVSPAARAEMDKHRATFTEKNPLITK